MSTLDTHPRTFVKSLSYRTVSALNMFFISLALGLGAEVGIKTVIASFTIGLAMFWTHERVWTYFKLWNEQGKDLHRRSLIKTITWRISSFIGLFFIAKMIGLTNQESIELVIVSNVMFIVVHYLHERVWNWIRWGKKAAEPVEVDQNLA
jgi:uncharacterized membrane protein